MDIQSELPNLHSVKISLKVNAIVNECQFLKILESSSQFYIYRSVAQDFGRLRGVFGFFVHILEVRIL